MLSSILTSFKRKNLSWIFIFFVLLLGMLTLCFATKTMAQNASLTVIMTIPDVLEEGESEYFITSLWILEAEWVKLVDLFFSFESGETEKSHTVTGLEQGEYYVLSPWPGSSGWDTSPDESLTIDCTDCTMEVIFNITTGVESPPQIFVQKETIPIGNEANWEFVLYQVTGEGNIEIARDYTDLTGSLSFFANQGEGEYLVVETTREGEDWYPVGPSECSIIVDLPEDAGNTFNCNFTNEYNASSGASITFEKRGDAVSKVGDTVDYTIILTNTSPEGTPDLECTITDTMLEISENVTLPTDANHVITRSREVQSGDPNPLVNMAEVTCSPVGSTDVITRFATHSVILCQPQITFEKSGDSAARVGEMVDYTIILTNTSTEGTPDLECTITDTMLEISENVTLPTDANYVITRSREVQPDDPNPLVNMAEVTCSPVGLPNVITESDTHSVDVILCEPSIAFEKTGDSLSKIGDPTYYSITLTNTSSEGTPDLECTIIDAALDANVSVTLPFGAPPYVIERSVPIPYGADDPYVNTAYVTCSPVGFPNIIEADANHSVDLFQPSIAFEKTGDSLSKIGDPTDYTITLTNTSSLDTPDLECTIIDSALDANVSVTLPAGTPHPTYVIERSVPIPYGADDPYVNTAYVTCSPVGFPNIIEADANHSVDLIHPNLAVSKTCANEPVPQEGSALYTIEIENTGDVELIVTADDGIGTFNLPAGGKETFEVSVPVLFSGQETVWNEVTASWVLPEWTGLSNSDTISVSDICTVGGRINLLKLTHGMVDPNKDWSFSLTGPGLPGGEVTDNTFGDGDGYLDFDNANLDPYETYTICELGIPAGWTSIWMIDTDNDLIADTIVIPYNPNAYDDPPQDLGNRCFDFGAGTPYPIPPGGTLVFEVDNTFPGGDPRSPGFWKNWNTCTGGNQAQTAAKNGGPDEGWYLLDDILNDPGINWADFIIDDCEEGVSILDKRDINNGKKMASDAGYKLASALLAAQLNFAAGAETCQEAQDAALAAENLLVSIGFDGSGKYLRSKDPEYHTAIELSDILDQYNNGMLCNPHITQSEAQQSNNTVYMSSLLNSNTLFRSSNSVIPMDSGFGLTESFGSVDPLNMAIGFSMPSSGIGAVSSMPFDLGSDFLMPPGLSNKLSMFYSLGDSFSQSSGMSPGFYMPPGLSNKLSMFYSLGDSFSQFFGMSPGFYMPSGLGSVLSMPLGYGF